MEEVYGVEPIKDGHLNSVDDTLRSEAKLCLNCKRWTFRYQTNCPECKGTNFTYELDYFVKKAKKQQNIGPTIFWMAGIILFFIVLIESVNSSFPPIVIITLPAALLFLLIFRGAASLIGAFGSVKVATVEMHVQQIEFDNRLRDEVSNKLKQRGLELFNNENDGLRAIIKGNNRDAIKYLGYAKTLRLVDKAIVGALAMAKFLQGEIADSTSILEDHLLEIVQIENYLSNIDQSQYETPYDASLRANVLILEYIYGKTGLLSNNACTLILKKRIFQDPDLHKLKWLANEFLRLGYFYSAIRLYTFLNQENVKEHLTAIQGQEVELGYIISKIFASESVSDEIYKWYENNNEEKGALELLTSILIKYNQRTPESVQIYEKYFNRNSEDLSIYEIILNEYLRSKKWDKAQELVGKTKEIIFTNPLLAYKSAMVYLQMNDIDKAVVFLQRILKTLKPGEGIPYDQIHSILGKAYQKKGLLEIALNSLQNVQELNRRHEEVYQLGIVAQERHQGELALRCFSEIYRENAGFKDVSAQIERIMRSQNGA